MREGTTGKRPLRIAVLSSLPRDSGGHLRAAYIAKYLRRAGAEVRLFASVRSLPLFLDFLVSALTHLRATWPGYDVLIAQKPLFNVAVPLLLHRLRGGVTIVDVDDDDAGFRAGLVSLVNRYLQRPLPRRATLVTYHTPHLRRHVRENFGVDRRKLFRLPQGVDLEIFSCPDSGSQSKRGSDNPLIVYPAHLNVASEIEAVFRVIGLARKDLPSLHLLVAGGGPREAHIRRRAAELGLEGGVSFTGHVAPGVIAMHLRRATAGILYYEPRPANLCRESMKLREMLALGMPVVCNDFGELAAFAPWTYQGRGHAGVARELLRLLATGGDGREQVGRDHVRKTMDWSVIAGRLHRRLEHAIRSAPGLASDADGRQPASPARFKTTGRTRHA